MEYVNLSELVERFGGRLMTGKELLNAIGPAQRKLDCIISKYGDCGGERRKPEYLAQLIVEHVNEQRYAECFSKKEKALPEQYPSKTTTLL
ncbi:MAG: hypothetical protein LUH82_02140 [Clostridiales bacterium]|nr:hypothetical protein [Clostridiales bacterium]